MNLPARSAVALGPFQAATATPGAMVGRAAERARVEQAIGSGTPLLITGPRRHGKTTLLRAAATVAAVKHGVALLHFDVEAFESLDLLAQTIQASAARALAAEPPRQAPVPSRAAVPRGVRHDALPLVADALDAVNALAQATGSGPVIVVLDEVHPLLEAGGGGAEGEIRSWLERHSAIRYLFASSEVRRLAELTRAGTLFGDPGSRLAVGALPRMELLEFLEAGFGISGFSVDPGALEVLLDLAQEVPYDVLRLAHACWEWLRADPARRLGVGAVADNRMRLVRQEAPLYTQLWLGLHKAQRIAVRAVIDEEGQGLMGRRTLARYGLGVSSMRQALHALEGRGVLRIEHPAGSGASASYRLVDPFFATWLRMAQTGSS